MVIALCIDSDGNTLYSVTNKLGIGVWDIHQGRRLGGLEDLPDRFVSHAAFDGSCEKIVTIEGTPLTENTVDTANTNLIVYQRINMETLFSAPLNDAQFSTDFAGLSPDGSEVRSLNTSTRKFQSWFIETGDSIETTFHGASTANVLAIGREKYFALGGPEGLIQRFDEHGRSKKLRHGTILGRIIMPLLR